MRFFAKKWTGLKIAVHDLCQKMKMEHKSVPLTQFPRAAEMALDAFVQGVWSAYEKGPEIHL